MKIYNEILQKIIGTGIDREGRNGWTRAIFAEQMRFKMDDGFPAVTTKRLAFNSVKGELLWFLEGSNDDNRLKEIMGGAKKTIWTDNAQSDYWKPKAQFDGDLGRIYGVQWRLWQTNDGKEVDQLAQVVDNLKNNPTDRRLVVSAWNPGELERMALPPCHMLFQFFLADGKLSLHMVQRSCDMFLGVPFNIASYALLLHMVAQVTGTEAHECILTLNDAHIYHEHYPQVKEQLSREPMPLPRLWLNPAINDIDGFTMDDIKLENYSHHPAIPAPMIV
ncbi:thymidylate synthase [Candidatus Kaiserbacteria bacterium RIFCSPHIGHO2_01_FULL_50_13]|uniref:Thymidylate synthase n=1 Tax=Candidatus Kaiserbacteria bacterium RIFCSPLOWO2_01_FULL_50_24 TaxID=1798507 RepID=A0A1F6EMH4_9BACT|nr:MAG: thymidylate synthase [Candidatus Kaiserbacteria bacterium RIFCSPHIGHO2_01_FULL_50_13]OGG74823.1 MAG: thymidylate synthase [Candidatus Kaiserbacteria bacterium RIFCSPLOWO2_01_FULL_50_24]OGG81406.1 MAG: thymidylate synthase [Candidatus Kaiserbacteria bacterium RIFCSPLOWO2_02_FULL_51_13]